MCYDHVYTVVYHGIHGIPRFTMVNYGTTAMCYDMVVPWFTMVYHGKPWYTVVYTMKPYTMVYGFMV